MDPSSRNFSRSFSKPLIIFVALLWGLSSSFTSFLRCGAQNWTQCCCWELLVPSKAGQLPPVSYIRRVTRFPEGKMGHCVGLARASCPAPRETVAGCWNCAGSPRVGLASPLTLFPLPCSAPPHLPFLTKLGICPVGSCQLIKSQKSRDGLDGALKRNRPSQNGTRGHPVRTTLLCIHPSITFAFFTTASHC